MGKTCGLYMKFVEDYVSTCYDSLALFLCIQMVQRLQYLCHKRAVPALDFYYESLVGTLWPRFETIVQTNIQSVRDCDPTRLYTAIDTRPHYVVRRYAEYTSAISAIQEYSSVTSAMDWTPRLHRLLSQLQEEVEGFTLRLAAVFIKRKDQLVSLINNFDLMFSVMTERTHEESREASRCKVLLTARIAEFVEEILFFHFEGLVRFVKDCELMLERGNSEALRSEERRATHTINTFMANWKKSLDEINKDILKLFPNFKNGTNILQATLTQLVEYYHRFQKILSQHPFRNVPARADLINIHQLMVENIPTTPLKNPSTPRKQEKNTPKQQGSSKTYEEYWNGKQVEEGLENGSLIQGVLRINPKNYREAFIHAPDGTEDILIEGLFNRNRALNGDVILCVMLPPEARQLTADFSSTPKKPTHQTPKKPQFTVKKDILSQSTSLALGDPELENISITQTITKVNLESQKPFNKTPQKNQQTPARKTSGSGKKLPDRHRTPENETKSSKDADGACGRDEIDQTVTVPDEKIVLSEKDVLNLIKPEGAQSPFTPEPNKNRRRKPKKQTPAENQDSAQDEVCEPRDEKADVINSPKVEQTVGTTPSSAAKKKTRRSKRRPKQLDDSLVLQLEDSCTLKETVVTDDGTVEVTKVTSETFVTVNAADVVIENSGQNNQLVSRKIAKVVFIKEYRHSRRAIGCLRPWPYGQNSAIPKWALFVPRDHRVPRLKIPFTAEVASCFAQPPSMLYLAQIDQWDDINHPQGSLCYLVGNSGNMEAETMALLLEHEVDYTPFPGNVLQALPQLPWSIPNEEYIRRRDFRKDCIFTIDPSDARDLDDAVCGRFLRVADDGTRLYNISVHIADVSFFVNEGTALDEIASRRATSNYLVDRVIPMLPSVLCEHVCSLNPGEDRLAFSVEWTVNDKGEILDEWFGRSIIKSCVKLSYDHAQAVIEGREDGEINWPELKGPHTLSDVRQSIQVLQELAAILRKKRVDQGALRIDLPRLAFSMDWATRTPVGFRVYEMKESNRLIEEFMLLANMRVAEKIYRSFPHIAVLRSHPPPLTTKMEQLSTTLQAIGIHLDVSTSSTLQESLVRYALASSDPIALGRSLVLNNLVAKPMKNAVYICSGLAESELHFRHYALSVPFYTHFTSPIRRYPDILVHRLLNAALEQESLDHWQQDYVKKQLDICNQRKLAAKTLQDAHGELHLANLVRRSGFIEVKGIVLNVLDHSVDVVLVYLGIVRRLYLDKLPLKQLQHEKYHGIGKLTLEWQPEVPGAEPVHQVITIFSMLEIQLVPHAESEKLEFNLVLMRPTSVPS
nr:EOG090X047D [Moina brachiata]